MTVTGNAHVFILQFLSLFIEAMPFLLLGSMVSGLVETYVQPRVLQGWLPKQRVWQACAGACLGMVLPVCECGVVPVARRFLHKGMPLSMVTAFLLGAPVINPVVLFGTWKAFGWSGMLFGRVLLTFIVAAMTGYMVAGTAAASVVTVAAHQEKTRSLRAALVHAAEDVLHMGAYLIVGALLASAAQTYVPLSALAPVGMHPVLSVPLLELLAYVLSICSTVDAFVALGFVGFATPGAVLSFLVFGPMVDIKSTMMFLSVFPKRLVRMLLLWPLFLVTTFGILINFLPSFWS